MSSEKNADLGHPLAACGGVANALVSDREPYAALIDLMVVIEALSPRWPLRELPDRAWKFKL